MMRIKTTHYSAYLMLFMVMIFTGFSFSAHAGQENEQEKADKVILNTWLSEPSNSNESLKEPRYAVNEQIILYIEVTTPRWFTSGTRIANIEIPNVVTKQRNTLATNFTERKNGVTWSHQRWEITLYPQEKGRFIVPSTAVSVEVSREGGGKGAATLYSAPQQFIAVMPSGLLSAEQQWVSGRDFTIEQQWSRSNDDLKVGDAITRTLIIKGEDTLAMLIPKIIDPTSTNEYQTYAQPTQLVDSQTRGDYLSERKESSVYVLQSGGEFTFPTYQFTWWDLDSQQLKTIEVAGQAYKVSHTLSSRLKMYWKTVVILFVSTAILGVLAIKLRHYYKTHPLPTWLVYSRAVKHGQWGRVRVLLYRALRQQHQLIELKSYVQDDKWQQDSMDFQNSKVTASQARRLWKKVSLLSNPWVTFLSRVKPKSALLQLDKYRKSYQDQDR